MKKFNSFEFIPREYANSVVAIGNFDGIHIGHQKVFGVTKELAFKKRVPSSILTFEPHPRVYFSPDSPSFQLVSSETRAKLIRANNFDVLFELPFDKKLANLSSSDFIHQVLNEGLQVSQVVVGEDFRFGKGREGTTNHIIELGISLGIEVTVLPKLSKSGLIYSSSVIREALREGNPELAKDYLGRWHSIIGKVQEGLKVGRSIGYPTANLEFDRLILPKFGVYSVLVEILTGKFKGYYQGAASIGTKPTIGNHSPNLETFIFDFEGDIYGEEISVSLIKYLRPEIKFDSIEDLVTQMKSDCREARNSLAGISSN